MMARLTLPGTPAFIAMTTSFSLATTNLTAFSTPYLIKEGPASAHRRDAEP